MKKEISNNSPIEINNKSINYLFVIMEAIDHHCRIIKIEHFGNGVRKKKKLFTLILTNNRQWGSVLVPYIIIDESNRGYYKLS